MSEKRCILIGSAGWIAATGDHLNGRKPGDIDLIMSLADFSAWVSKNKSQIDRVIQFDVEKKYNTPIKFAVITTESSKIEVEISEAMPCPSLSLGDGTVVENLTLADGKLGLNHPVWVPPPASLLALKFSHLCFAYNWDKTASDIISMLRWFEEKSMNSVLSDPNASNLTEIIEQRVRINAAANFSLPGFKAPQLQDTLRGVPTSLSISEAKAILQDLHDGGESIAIGLMKEVPKVSRKETGQKVNKRKLASKPFQNMDTSTWTTLLQSRFLPFVIDQSDLSGLNRTEISVLLQDLISLFAVHYYINTGRVKHLFESNQSAAVIAEKTWRAALQTLSTNLFVDLSLDVSLASKQEFHKWYDVVKLYDTPPPGSKAELVQSIGNEVSFTAAPHLQEKKASKLSELTVDASKIDMPTLDQVQNMHIPFRSVLFKSIVTSFDSLWSVPPFYLKFIESTIKHRVQASAPPTDVWQHVATNYVHDHVTLNALAIVNKSLNHLICRSNVSNTFWKRLLRACWNNDRVESSIAKTPSIDKNNAREMFKATFKIMWSRHHAEPYECQHCGQMHTPIPKEIFEANGFSDYNERFGCACPDCWDFTNSWEKCEYHSETII